MKNIRTNGWDERDYKLWSQVRSLPSYGIVAGADNSLIARNDVIRLLKEAAEKRFNERIELLDRKGTRGK